MAITSPLLQDQQQTPGSVPNPPQKTSAAAASFGNIVPFIVVICIVAVISIVSCVVGRIYSRRVALSTPLQSGVNINIKPGNWVERIKKRFRRGKAGAVEVGHGSGDQAGTNDGNAQVAVAGGNDQQPPSGPPPPA